MPHGFHALHYDSGTCVRIDCVRAGREGIPATVAMPRSCVADMLMHVRTHVLEHLVVDGQAHLPQHFSVSRVCCFGVYRRMFCFNICCRMRRLCHTGVEVASTV